MFKQTVYLAIVVLFSFSFSLGINTPLLANTKVNTFIDNGNGSVTDTATGLIWQQGNLMPRDQGRAISFCNNLNLAGSSNWRLPNIKELITIVDYRVNNPSIDDAMFPNTDSLGYWSVTNSAIDSDLAWVVNFNNGFTSSVGTQTSNLIRCVRTP